MTEIATKAAVLFRDGGAKQTKVARFFPGLDIHLALFAPFVVFWCPFGVDEVRCHLSKHFMLVGHPMAHTLLPITAFAPRALH